MKVNLTTLLWLLAFGLLGGSALYFVVTVNSLNFSGTLLQTVVPSGTGTGVSATSYSGTIVKADVVGSTYGTHRLLDDSGAVVAYLESRNIDLRYLEGKKATFEGKRERMVDSGLPLVAVEKVNYN